MQLVVVVVTVVVVVEVAVAIQHTQDSHKTQTHSYTHTTYKLYARKSGSGEDASQEKLGWLVRLGLEIT